jgi:uncharacterized protein YecE (DUF72 family)
VGEVWIGTSGWHYKHWVGNFYPPRLPSSRMLAHYIQHFDTVELNNTFYKLPAKTSLLTWRDSTPLHFHFAVKGSRFLTHMKKLNNAEEGLNRFLESVDVLNPKLGPILFQLPPNWELNLDKFGRFRRASFSLSPLRLRVSKSHLEHTKNVRPARPIQYGVLHFRSEWLPVSPPGHGRFLLHPFARARRQIPR